MTTPVPPNVRAVIIDVAERTAVTFLEALLAYLLATGAPLDITHVAWGRALSISGGAALLALIKSLIAAFRTGTPSLVGASASAAEYGKHAATPAAEDAAQEAWLRQIKEPAPTRPTPYRREEPVTRFRLGRLPNDPTKPRVRLTALEAPASYSPPPSVDWHTNVPASSWGMDGNDSIGDCTCAEVDHCVKTLQVAAGNPEVKSTTKEVVSLYSTVTGYDPSKTRPDGSNPTDNGAMMQDVRNYWRKNGVVLGGTKHTIALFAQVDHADHNLIKWCIARFGEVGLGFDFPASAMQQFNAGQPWTVVDGSKIEGGHAVGAVGYDAGYVYVTTWGTVQRMAWAFFDKYVSEAWTQLSTDFVNSASGDDPLAETAYALGQQFEAVTGQANPFPAPQPPPAPQPTPGPAPSPAPVVVPADWVIWARHALTLKGQSHLTTQVAREIIAAAGQ